MSTLHSMKKTIKQNQPLLFPVEMYENIFGSIIICGYIFAENPVDRMEIVKKWNKVYKAARRGKDTGINWTFDDENFIDKTLEFFGLKRPEDFPVAEVVTNLNVLIAPYVDGKLLPLREDGFYTKTLRDGKIYPIDFNANYKEAKPDEQINK